MTTMQPSSTKCTRGARITGSRLGRKTGRRRMPLLPKGILILLLAAAPLAGEPREQFFALDQPIGYGYQELEQRLGASADGRATLALHLSGGSARAFAHLGVLKRLEEDGVYPDVIATNSMGSIIGLLYAAGVPLEVIEEVLLTLDYGQLFTVKLPTAGGLMDPRGLLAAAYALVGDPDLADLPIPIVVVCEDLRSLRRVLLCRGSFLSVLQAAIAMPGALEPVDLEEFTLIDGGITNLVPLAEFAGLADLAISATAFYDRDLEPDDPVTVLNIGINIAKSRTAVRDIKTFKPFLIRSDVEQFTYMGYGELPQIIRRGYDSCAARSAELERELEAAGFSLPAAEPAALASSRALYAERWARIKRQLQAERDLPLPRGFSALQVQPLLLKRYRGAHRLEQANYLAAGYRYESSLSGLGIGALSDLQGKWGARLSLSTWLWRSLDLEVDGLLFFSTDGGQVGDPYAYGSLAARLPLPAGRKLLAAPFFRGELHLELPAGEKTLYLSSGLEARLQLPGSRRLLAGELAWFFQYPQVHGLSGELLGRIGVAGPLKLFSRALLRASCSPGGGGITATYNDFYRGVLPGRAAESFAVLNGELILAPESLSFSLWELFLLGKFELSAFCDLLWEDALGAAAAPLPSVGVSLGGELALLGLMPLRVSAAGGYDLAEDRPFLALNLGAPY